MTEKVPIAFVDTETTGLHADDHEIWEVGLVVRRTDGVENIRKRWLLPVDLGNADPVALKIGDFYSRYPSTSESWQITNLRDFSRDFERHTRGTHLVGAVPSFDEERLRHLLQRNGACPGWHYHIVDVEAAVAGKLGIKPPWKSDDLSLEMGVDPVNFDRHTALGDVDWAMALYDAVFNV